LKNIFYYIKLDAKLQIILMLGFAIQMLTSLTAHGFFHPDQHFQLLEFSSYQLHKSNSATNVWEFDSKIRPTFQVYLLSGYRIIIEKIGIINPFLQLTVLRFINGLLLYLVFNCLAIWQYKNVLKRHLYIVLLVLNFSWFLPYSRTLFSSEMLSSVLFFGAFFMFYRAYINNKKSVALATFTGLIMCCSFYTRFQMAFAILGFIAWLLLVAKQYKIAVFIAIGGIFGLLLNTMLDYNFYGTFVITPWLYYQSNITFGKAASFGTQAPQYYLFVLLAITTIAPLSFFLLYQYCKISISKYKNPLAIIVLFFIVGHCLVGHKEERFLFPIVNILPLLLAVNITQIEAYFNNAKTWLRFVFRSSLYISIVLNFLLLCLFLFIPYTQTIVFANKIQQNLKPSDLVYCIDRTPNETVSKSPLVFYGINNYQMQFISVKSVDSIASFGIRPKYIAAEYNIIKSTVNSFKKLGYTPLFYSSEPMFMLNQFLNKHNINTINDIWVLYQYKGK
jgi:GPI mannosyltransferase 3